MRAITGIAEFIIRRRKVIIILTILITIVSAFFLKDLQINSDILSYLPKDDPLTRLNDYLSEEYGGSQLAIIAIEAEEVMKPEIIRYIHNLTSEFQLIPGIQFVTSLTNVLDIKEEEGWIMIGRLIDQDSLPESEEELLSLKSYLLSKDMFRGRLLSHDGKATIIICRLQESADKAIIAAEIRRRVDSVEFSGKVYFAGLPFQMSEISNLVLRDITVLVPLSALLIILALLISFRSARGMFLPLSTAAIAIIWTLSLMSILKVAFSVISNIIPVVLLAVGSAYSIHVLSKFNEKNEKPSTALSNVALPVILAAITTMAGFIAFVFSSYFHMIRDFGVFSTLGIFFTLLLSLFFTPAVLSYLPPLKKPPARKKEMLKQLAQAVSRHSILILACGLLLVLVSFFYISRVEREVDIISYFKSNTDIRMAEDLMKDKFGGSTTIQILAAGDMQEPGVIREVKNMENFLKGHEHIHNVYSIVEIIEQMNWVIDHSKEIPDSREKIGNLWFLLEGEEAIEQLVNQDKSEAVIRATLGNQNSRDIAYIVHSIESYLAENRSAEIEFQLCGSASVYHRVDSAIKQSQRQSLLIAIALIFLVNIFLLGSLHGALIGLIPIVFTLTMLFGFMGLTTIPLDVATVLIGSISIGIGIDYSIHFINRYREEMAISGNAEEALAVTLSTTGRAIATNVATVSLGFIILLFGNFIPLQRFGLLIVVTMISSGTAALTLLPAALLLKPLQPNKGSKPGNKKQKN